MIASDPHETDQIDDVVYAADEVDLILGWPAGNVHNRRRHEIQVKLDELIRAIGHARNELLDLEELEEKDLDALKQTFVDMAKQARDARTRSRVAGRGSPLA